MKKFGSIISIITTILKYAGIIGAFIKAFQVLKDELEKLEGDEVKK